MANEFGASHRALVQDTNDGNVAPAPKATTTSINVTGRSTQTIGKDNKAALTQGLLDVATGVVSKINERQKKVDYAEGFNKGLDEGYEETQKSPLRDMLFGKSATLRGAQDRIIANDSRQWLNSKMKSLKDDIKTMDEDEYQQFLTDELKGALEDHTDPEVKAAIQMQAAKQFETLARNHTQMRQAHIDMTNDQAVEDTMYQATQGMRTAQQFGDLKAQREAQDAAEEMFDQPLDMDSDVWLATTNRVIIKQLGQGDDLAYRMAEAKGIIDMMPPREQAKLNVSQQVYARKNGRDYQLDSSILKGRIAAGSATDDEIAALQAKYPNQVNANDWRDVKLKQDEALATLRKEQAEATDALISGDVAFNNYTPVQRKQAVAEAFNGLADDGLALARRDMIANGQYDGDPNAPFTQAQRMDYMLDNPYKFASMAAQHPEEKFPAIQNMATQIMFDMRNENLTESDIDGTQKKMEFLEQFKSQLGNNFQKQFRSTDDAANYAVYSGLVKDVGMHPVNAMREVRRIQSADAIDIKNYTEAISDSIGDIEDDFLDESPQSQGINGMWYATDEFDTTLTEEIERKMTKYTEIYKGDMEAATRAAKADIRRNGVVSNGQFIEGGAHVNIRGGSIEDYIRGVNADDNLRSQITNLGLGFSVDTDYTSLKITTDPFNKQNIILHSVHETSGHPISVVLNTPTSGADFSTYGVNTFTGYNPNIADRKERAAAMIKDNTLLRGHRAVGDAINQMID